MSTQKKKKKDGGNVKHTERGRESERETAEGAEGSREKWQILHMTSMVLPLGLPGAQTSARRPEDTETQPC